LTKEKNVVITNHEKNYFFTVHGFPQWCVLSVRFTHEVYLAM